MCLCEVLHGPTAPWKGTCIRVRFYTSPPKRVLKINKGRTGFCLLFTTTFSHHMVSPLLGMVRQLNVSPQQPTHIPPLIIISKSRAAYALNIRLLCMVINPIIHMDKWTAPQSRYRSVQHTLISSPELISHLIITVVPFLFGYRNEEVVFFTFKPRSIRNLLFNKDRK